MAGILRSCSGRSDGSTITFLVVATGDLCEKISEGLLQVSKERQCRTVVHQSESITQVVRLIPELSVDFVVFGFDWRLSHTIAEIEENISQLDEHFIISGCSCLINCTGVPQPISRNFCKVTDICNKYNLILLTTTISEPREALALANRILNLAEARLGTKTGFPMLPRPQRTE